MLLRNNLKKLQEEFIKWMQAQGFDRYWSEKQLKETTSYHSPAWCPLYYVYFLSETTMIPPTASLSNTGNLKENRKKADINDFECFV